MRRALIGVAAAAVIAVVAAQVFVPGLAEDRIEDRLTAGGGEAEVSVSAVPAVRLLLGDGDRIEVAGSGLALDLVREPKVLDRLDGFGDVDVLLDDFRAGPFEVRRFELVREGDEPYRLYSRSIVSGGSLVEFGVGQAGLPGGSLLRSLLGATGITERAVPIELEMEVESDDGRVRVVSGGGTVAGFPTGPLAQLLTAAIAVQF